MKNEGCQNPLLRNIGANLGEMYSLLRITYEIIIFSSGAAANNSDACEVGREFEISDICFVS